MNTVNTQIISLLGAALLCGTSMAEEVKLKIHSIEIDDNVYTPHFKADTEQDHSRGPSQRWIRMEVKYSTRGGWINELTIQHFALAGINTTCPAPVILTEEVTYINIGEGNHVSYVYMHPNTVKRYDSSAKKIEAAAVFVVNGKVIATERSNRNTQGNWTTDKKYHLHEGYLLSEPETPFWFINYDYKEIIKHIPHPSSTNACRTNVAEENYLLQDKEK